MSVSRLDSGDNTNANLWVYTSGAIPSGDVVLDGRHPSPVNGGRVFILFYVAEANGTFAPTITIGGVSPSYSYTNEYSLSTDLKTAIWVWDDADIQSWASFTIATGGTWPSVTDEGWGYCGFMNVDQDTGPIVNYEENGSTASFDVDTTSDSDDVIIGISIAGTNTSYTGADTMWVHRDDGVGGARIGVFEGVGGDNASTITSAASADHATYSIILPYKKYAVAWHWKEDPINRTNTDSSFVNPEPQGEISSNVLMPGRTYLGITKALINQNSTSAAVLDCQMNRESGSAVATSGNDNRESRRSASTYGQQFFYMGEHTIATVAGGWYGGDGYDYQYRHRTDGVVAAYCKHLITSFIDISDFDTGDYYYVDDTTGYNALDNSGWTDTASQTLGDGSSDWVFFYAVKVTVDSTSASIRIRLTIDDVVVGNQYLEFEGEDSGENWWLGGMATADAVAASSDVVVEVQTDSSTAGLMDVEYSRLVAIRLDQFEDHFTDYDAAGATISSVDTDTLIDSVAHTTDTVGNANWMIGYFGRGDDHGENTKTIGVDLRDGTGTADRLCSDTTRNICGNGANDRYPLGPLWALDQNLADATSKTYRVYGNEENDVSPAVGIDEQWMFGFSTVFAAEAAAGGEQAGSLLSVGVGY